MRSAILLVVLAIGAYAPARAADPVLDEATDLASYVMFAESGAPGMILAVVRGDNSVVLSYGETQAGNHVKPDGNSLFRLNSITKVFATEVLTSLAADRKLSLSDPLQRYAGDVSVPAFDGREITLLDLATHSAALPREVPDAPEGVHPRAWPTREDRWKWLPGYKLPWAPGTIAAYSNIGFDLLADAIEVAGDRPYPDLLTARVTAKLGMVDTGFAPNSDQCARLMTGSGIGGAAACVDTHATDGSGGLYSTGNDMALWLRHNIAETGRTLSMAHAVYRPRQALSSAIGFDEAGPMAGLGLGWVAIAADGARPMLLAKSGAGVGFMSYIAFAPGRDVGVFVVVSRADFGTFAKLTKGADDIIASLTTR